MYHYSAPAMSDNCFYLFTMFVFVYHIYSFVLFYTYSLCATGTAHVTTPFLPLPLLGFTRHIILYSVSCYTGHTIVFAPNYISVLAILKNWQTCGIGISGYPSIRKYG